MAKITLRAYNREIENQINHGQTQEAIAHCKYLLKLFPKHVDSYRFLGKAYLEAQRYTEAADVLTRVLSIIPDDFIAQLGMSIIREDEGNLDAAIYHMERAFEVKPSNSAVQDELRRLYGRRDGIEPPRVRLTRGALVRMYARGELFEQAVYEIRAALADDPQRIDLEVILARMYLKLGKKIEAADVCGRIMAKLPNCLEANQILAEFLPGTSRSEDAKVYQQRVISLDPYSAYIGANFTTSIEVPDNAISIEHLEWHPGMEKEETEQPDWARQIGVQIQKEEEIPSWLIDASQEKPVDTTLTPSDNENQPVPIKIPPFVVPVEPLPEEIIPPEEVAIPEWMRDAGWTEASGPEQTPPPFENSEGTEDQLSQAEIPDWVKDMAPEEKPETSEDQEKFLNLEQILPPQTTSLSRSQEPVLSIEESSLPQEEAAPSNDFPDWLNSFSPEEQNEATAIPDKGVPDWLNMSEDTGEQPPFTESAQEVPSWLSQIGGSKVPLLTNEPSEIPLQSTETSSTLPEAEIPTQPITITSQPTTSENDVCDTISEVCTSPAEEELKQSTVALIEQSTEQSFEQPLEQVMVQTEVSNVGQPEDLVIETSPVQAVETMSEQQTAEDMETSLAWLEALAAHQSTNEEILITPPEKGSEPPQEWITQTEETEVPIQSAPLCDVTPSKTEEEDLGFSWSESLDSKQDTPEETIITFEEGRGDKSTTWSQEPESRQDDHPNIDQEPITVQPIDQEEVLPDWLQGIELPESDVPVSPLQDEPETITQWLDNLNVGPVKPVESTSKPPTEPEEQLPDWLKDLDVVQPSSLPESEPPLPTWLQSEELSTTPEVDMPVELTENLVVDEICVEKPVEIPVSPGSNMIEEGVEALEEVSSYLSTAEERVSTPVIDSMVAEPILLNQQDGQEKALESVAQEEEETPQSITESFEEPKPAFPEDNEAEVKIYLAQARSNLEEGKLDQALFQYNNMIDKDQELESIINDLYTAIDRYPLDIDFYLALGDALQHGDKLQEALDIYTKAEELIH
jgi:tetratricopeptide (TPR) repeat protein